MLRHPAYKGLRDDKPADEVEAEGRTVRFTNLDKTLFPKTGFTKGELIDYYERIGELVLPHLHGRPPA